MGIESLDEENEGQDAATVEEQELLDGGVDEGGDTDVSVVPPPD